MLNKQQYVLISDKCQHCCDLTAIMQFINLPLATVLIDDFNSLDNTHSGTHIICTHLLKSDKHLEQLNTITRRSTTIIFGKQPTAFNHITHINYPIEQQQLLQTLQAVQQTTVNTDEECLQQLVGESSAMTALRRTITQVADSDSSVLILGESGTGKELVASSVHQLSKRSSQPYVPVNCGAIPAELMESELFGHEKGAFTGAINRRQGRFELANNGTLFLDEIGDMQLPMQVKLLRVLQEHCFERIGSNQSINTDVRIIAATHKNLEQAIEDNQFREDLYYRLNVFPLKIPALRERESDIPLLLQHFITKLSTQLKSSITFSDASLTMLQRYPWPGNIRELSNLVEHMMVLYPNMTIEPQHIPKKYHQTQAIQQETPISLNDLTLDINALIANKGTSLKHCLLETELMLIMQALDQCNGNVTTTAKYLSVGRTTLIEKMRKHGIRYRRMSDANINESIN